ncbi:MAG: pantetheine-phosphate adenylyltransferase [Deltaproteobacteria bacterium]|nr:pantetheine-phosphate adenylyltransferase [Deltaproteobacteria bacterium]
MASHIAIYPGTFDPITRGHLDIIERSFKLFDELIIAVVEHSSKSTLFSVEERVEMIRAEVGGQENVRVESFDGLLINYVKEKNAYVVVRGLRVMSDFEYEFQMALTNRKIAPDIETVFMMTAENYTSVSSRFIKEIARLGGEVDHFVTPSVEAALKDKFSAKIT